ncbi:MAG: FAD-binding oxidoreductase [Peptostreptococcaceae bacterium]|nr:FAD-binding oxidoreductase [Peptostreptococcaceae bacterium]
MDEQTVKKLREICGENFVIEKKENVAAYLYDETEYHIRPKANEDCVVVKPGSEEEISRILKLANEKGRIVIPRGGGTGLCGAAIPTQPSIILSMERFKEIVELDEANSCLTVQGGVTLGEMNEYLAKHSRLYFPCHPGDESAHMAGLAVENAGGARAVRHGVMRNHIRGMRIVLPTGEIIKLGGKLSKDNAGYSIMQLIIGSEGTLGVVTEVTLKIYPKEEHTGTLLFSFESMKQAVDSVVEILGLGITPLAVEYMDRDIALSAADHLGMKWPVSKGNVDIIYILSSVSEDLLYRDAEVIEEICSKYGAVESVIAETSAEQENILKIRSNTYTSVKETIMDTLDITVPPAFIPELMEEFGKIAAKHGALINTVGHIGDGNVHNNIYLVDGKVPEYYEEMREELFAFAVKNGGTITGEHGIGKTRKSSMKLQFSKVELELMRKIKEVFDPKGILNPGTAIES